MDKNPSLKDFITGEPQQRLIDHLKEKEKSENKFIRFAILYWGTVIILIIRNLFKKDWFDLIIIFILVITLSFYSSHLKNTIKHLFNLLKNKSQ